MEGQPGMPNSTGVGELVVTEVRKPKRTVQLELDSFTMLLSGDRPDVQSVEECYGGVVLQGVRNMKKEVRRTAKKEPGTMKKKKRMSLKELAKKNG
jgi:hypothetical protein